MSQKRAKAAKGFGRTQQKQTQRNDNVFLTRKQKQQRNVAGESISIRLSPFAEVFYREDGRQFGISSLIPGFDMDEYWDILEGSYGSLPDGYYFVDHSCRKGNFLGESWSDAVAALVERKLAKITSVNKLNTGAN